MDKLYVIGKKVAGGYANGRYACTKFEGEIYDHYYVRFVLDYPSVRAVANEDAWSNAEVYPYCKRFSFMRSGMTRHPEEYTGTVTGLEEEDYRLSLIYAIEKAIAEYKEKGDTEAVERLQNRLAVVVTEVHGLIA